MKLITNFPQISALFLVSLLAVNQTFAADWNSLGSSQSILKKAKALDPDNKVRVVQKRAVSRDFRLEISSHYSLLNGGDSYVKTQAGGAQIEFHINPNWSVGFRYDSYVNSLTAEGEKLKNDATYAITQGNAASLPEINFPINSQLGTISWYPIYGKLNLFDLAVTQFDIYLMAGAGTIKLDSSQSSSLLSFGSGFGLWLSKHITSRFEIRYQSYKDKVYTSDPQVNLMSLQLGIGFLL